MANFAASGNDVCRLDQPYHFFRLKVHYPIGKILQVGKDHDTSKIHKRESFGREVSDMEAMFYPHHDLQACVKESGASSLEPIRIRRAVGRFIHTV